MKFLFRKGVFSELLSLLMELSCQFFLATPLLTVKFTLITTKDAFYSTLSKAIKNIKLEHPSLNLLQVAILMLLLAEIVNHGNNHDSDPTIENGPRFLKFCKGKELYMMNSYYGHKDIHRWSFYSNLGYKRRLHYILCEWYVKRFLITLVCIAV